MPSPLSRAVHRAADRFGIRPAALTLVLACSALVVTLSLMRQREFVASGVAQGSSIALSPETTATIVRVHVAVGQHVKQGELLVTLRSLELEAELAQVNASIRQVSRAADLAQAELLSGLASHQQEELLRLLEAERDARLALAERERERNEYLAAASFLSEAEELAKAGVLEAAVVRERADLARRQQAEQEAAEMLAKAQAEHAKALRKLGKGQLPERLLTATAELHRAELEVLERQREGLERRIAALELRAPRDGIVSELLPEGTVVGPSLPVVRIVPPYAEGVIAYLPPDAPPPTLGDKASYTVALSDGRTCEGVTQPRPTGEVVRKPEQLIGPFGFGAYGFPVRIALDEHCRLPIGQVVELRLSNP